MTDGDVGILKPTSPRRSLADRTATLRHIESAVRARPGANIVEATPGRPPSADVAQANKLRMSGYKWRGAYPTGRIPVVEGGAQGE